MSDTDVFQFVESVAKGWSHSAQSTPDSVDPSLEQASNHHFAQPDSSIISQTNTPPLPININDALVKPTYVFDGNLVVDIPELDQDQRDRNWKNRLGSAPKRRLLEVIRAILAANLPPYQ
jgi:hypothetical protein